MKKAFFALAILFLASCAREYLFEKPQQELKNEKPLWWVLQKKETGATALEFEDKWYRYEATFDYIKPGEYIQKNIIYGQCPIEDAEYKVTDLKTKQVVRLEHYNQIPCGPCHRR